MDQKQILEIPDNTPLLIELLSGKFNSIQPDRDVTYIYEVKHQELEYYLNIPLAPHIQLKDYLAGDVVVITKYLDENSKESYSVFKVYSKLNSNKKLFPTPSDFNINYRLDSLYGILREDHRIALKKAFYEAFTIQEHLQVQLDINIIAVALFVAQLDKNRS